jgi:hypothetical protein
MKRIVVLVLITYLSMLRLEGQVFKITYGQGYDAGNGSCPLICSPCIGLNYPVNTIFYLDSLITIPGSNSTFSIIHSSKIPININNYSNLVYNNASGCSDIRDASSNNVNDTFTNEYCQNIIANVHPIITLKTNVGNFVNKCSKDTIDFFSDSGFIPSKYKWEYRLSGSGSNGWTALPNNFSYINIHKIKFTLESLFGSNYMNFINVPLDFRINLDNCYNTLLDSSYRLNITFYKATPTISQFQEIKPLCSYNPNGGGAKYTFNRGLTTTETITFTLFKKLIINGVENNVALQNYTIQQTNLDALNSYTINGLSEGNYFFMMEGTDGATVLCNLDTFKFSLTPPTPVVYTVDSSNALCYGTSNGKIIFHASGGTPPYMYKIIDSNWLNLDTISNLYSKTYQVLVKDSRGCYSNQDSTLAIQSITILQPDSLQLRVDAFRHPLGYGRHDGFVKVSALGGTSPYTYTWSNGFTGLDNINLGDGMYRVTLSDAHGCSLQDSFRMIQPDPLVADIDTFKKILCHSDSNGSLVVHTIGGVKPYTFLWNTGHTDSIVHDLPTGTYTVTVVDVNGNDTTATVYLGEPDTLNITETIKPANCAEAADGAIDITPSGGVAPYTYEWVYGQHTQDISSLPAGNYYVSIRDSNQCRYDKSFVVPSPNALSTTILAQSPTCYQGSDGQIEVKAKGGTIPYTYQWSPVNATQSTISQLKADNYTSTVVDAQGCSYVNYALLIDPAQIQVQVPRELYVLCLGQKLELDGLALADPNVTYLWTSDKGYSNNQSFVSLEDSGKYTLTVKNSKGCIQSDVFEIKRSGETITSNFLVTSVAYNDTTLLAVNVGTSYDRALWHLPVGANAKVQNDSILEFRIASNGEYTLGMTAYKGQCEETMEKRIKIVSRPNLINKDSVMHQTLIQLLEMYPNPNQGLFTVHAQLYEKADLQIRIINLLSNAVVYTSLQEGNNEYTVPIDIQQSASGVYIIMIETKKDKQVLRLIKNG